MHNRSVLVRIEVFGVRSNGQAWTSAPGERPLLAVGDSFVFGADSQDAETWPAQLERRLGAHVLNGGVSGYGVDQTYLRAVALCRRLRPRVLLVGVAPDDVRRCGLSVRGEPKPWFEPQANGGLVLRGDPVPQRSMRFFRTFTASGAEAEVVAARLVPLFRPLAPRVLFVLYAHPEQDARQLDAVRTAARRSDVPVLDLAGKIAASKYAGDLDSHFNADGNRAVAAAVAGALGEPPRGWTVLNSATF